MARMNSRQQLQGLIGPVYVRTLNGQKIVQSRPSGRRKSEGTTISGKSFSRAVAQSRAIRIALRPILMQGTDSYVSQRLTGAIKKAIHHPYEVLDEASSLAAGLNGLEGFEFHKHTPFHDFIPMALPFELAAGGILKLEPTAIPAVDKRLLPQGTLGCSLAIMVSGWLPGVATAMAPQVFGFDLQSTAPTSIQLETTAFPEGTRLIVVAQLLALKSTTVLGDRNYGNSKGFNPAAVVFAGVV